MLVKLAKPLVPGERFELPTNGLQNRCSTTELTRQRQPTHSHKPTIQQPGEQPHRAWRTGQVIGQVIEQVIEQVIGGCWRSR